MVDGNAPLSSLDELYDAIAIVLFVVVEELEHTVPEKGAQLGHKLPSSALVPPQSALESSSAEMSGDDPLRWQRVTYHAYRILQSLEGFYDHSDNE